MNKFNKLHWLIAFLVCLAMATLSPLASSSPDGLERVAGDNGFLGMAQSPPMAVIADYLLPRMENRVLATILAGWLGVVLLFALAYGAAWLVYRLKSKRA